jgi:hypothetical protein
MKAKRSELATLADVRLVLTAPSADATKRKGYQAAQMAFLRAKQAFDLGGHGREGPEASYEWQRVHEARFGPERQERATLAIPDEGGEA